MFVCFLQIAAVIKVVKTYSLVVRLFWRMITIYLIDYLGSPVDNVYIAIQPNYPDVSHMGPFNCNLLQHQCMSGTLHDSTLGLFVWHSLPPPDSYVFFSIGLLLQYFHFPISWGVFNYGPPTRYVKLLVAHAPGMPGTFSPPPRVSDPDMHHGTCVTHGPWCMPGSPTSGFLWSQWRGKSFRYSRCKHNPQFYVFGKRTMSLRMFDWHCNTHVNITMHIRNLGWYSVKIIGFRLHYTRLKKESDMWNEICIIISSVIIRIRKV